MNDAEPEPRPPIDKDYMSESVARKKKRVTDTTTLRDMVDIQRQYLERDLRMEDVMNTFMADASSLVRSMSSYFETEREYLIRKEKREEERIELKWREVEEEEEELELKKKELGLPESEKKVQPNCEDTLAIVPMPSDSPNGSMVEV